MIEQLTYEKDAINSRGLDCYSMMTKYVHFRKDTI